jgi:hypothetical protein
MPVHPLFTLVQDDRSMGLIAVGTTTHVAVTVPLVEHDERDVQVVLFTVEPQSACQAVALSVAPFGAMRGSCAERQVLIMQLLVPLTHVPLLHVAVNCPALPEHAAAEQFAPVTVVRQARCHSLALTPISLGRTGKRDKVGVRLHVTATLQPHAPGGLAVAVAAAAHSHKTFEAPN